MKFNVQKSSSNAGLPTPKRGNVILAQTKDILQWPEISADGVAYEGNFVFVPGATFGQLYMTSSTQAATYEAGGNPDGMGSKNKFVGEYPGTSREIMAFLKKYANEGFIIFYGGCGTDEWKVMGSQCHSMKLSPAGKDDKDGNTNTLTFEQEQLNDDRVMFYEGDISFALPFTPSGPAFALDKSKGLQYQLPVSTAAANISFTSSDYENGTMVTLIGGGGSTPLLLKNGATGAVGVLLKNGTDWAALEGASIHFRVVVADKTYLVELSRK
ncbi:hypothetical protein [Elizabethkingia ursingii]|uniref:Uncharacterized protein n=1 Tax=Elizabethkingia ursingii TaxID=1756150 RepID=A0AAJ3NAS9_9FLAO|nr:hypothetical protein [Elizabethkingia ursingii]AQX08025.1 hypothetical protein BBD34_04920 [Elizabethkingia ursingii]OPB73621.1 hypothetical protein BAY32_11300 [Elizabethkingia ursingii]